MIEATTGTPEKDLRRVIVQRYIEEVIPTEYPNGRAVSLLQNWWEIVGKIVDFYDNEAKGLVGKSVVRTAEEDNEAWEKMRKLTDEIQSKLRDNDKLSNDQLNDWLGRITPTQLNAIIEGITESSLPIYSKSPNERFNDAVNSLTSH